MTYSDFKDCVEAQLARSYDLLVAKGKEYSLTADRLQHFKKAAALTGGDPISAAWGMLAKHLVSLSDMCGSGREFTPARWDEKISDSINYLLIIRALAKEEEHGQDRSQNTEP